MQQREYQDLFENEVIEQIEIHRTVCAQMPTGGGKTVIFCNIIKKYLRNHINIELGPTLILVHRKELLHQAAKSVEEVLGFKPCLITSDTDRFWISRVYIGMVDSTMNRLHMIVNPALIIIDEAHQQNFIKVHQAFRNSKILGWTATPKSVSPKTPMKNFYETIVTGPQIKELIALGFLSQNRTRTPKNSVNPSQFTYDKFIGDYNQTQLATTYRMSANIEACINNYWDYCLQKKTLVFNVNIEHSKEVCRYFNGVGIACKHLDATSPDRDEILYWFKTTQNSVLCSVMIPVMGYDEPTIEAIMLNYSTMSLVKFIQTSGRGSRVVDDYFIEKFQADYPYPLKLKDTFDIIDCGGNYKNFGDWNDDRDWHYIFWHPDLPGDGISPVKTCPECESLVHAAVRICPHCSYVFPKRKGEQIDLEEMILVTKGIDLDILNERSEKKYKYYPFFELALDVVATMHTLHGEVPSQVIVDRYFRIYYNLCTEWYNRTIGKNPEEMGDITNSMWHIKKARNNFNSLIIKKNKNSLTVNEKVTDVLNPDAAKLREKNWNNIKSEVLTK